MNTLVCSMCKVMYCNFTMCIQFSKHMCHGGAKIAAGSAGYWNGLRWRESIMVKQVSNALQKNALPYMWYIIGLILHTHTYWHITVHRNCFLYLCQVRVTYTSPTSSFSRRSLSDKASTREDTMFGFYLLYCVLFLYFSRCCFKLWPWYM